MGVSAYCADQNYREPTFNLRLQRKETDHKQGSCEQCREARQHFPEPVKIRHIPNRLREWWGRQDGTRRAEVSFQGVIALATIVYVCVALFQWSALKNQTQILYQEQVAQIGLISIEPANLGTPNAEVIVTIRNSGRIAAKDFWLRESRWSITPTGLQEQKLFAQLFAQTMPEPNPSPGPKAFAMATREQWYDLTHVFDPNLDIDDQHPTMPSETVIDQRVAEIKALGPLPPEFANLQSNSRKVIVGEIAAESTWPIRIKVDPYFGSALNQQSSGKTPPPPEKQTCYFALRYGYSDGLKSTRISPDFCFRYVPEDKGFSYCQKPAE